MSLKGRVVGSGGYAFSSGQERGCHLRPPPVQLRYLSADTQEGLVARCDIPRGQSLFVERPWLLGLPLPSVSGTGECCSNCGLLWSSVDDVFGPYAQVPHKQQWPYQVTPWSCNICEEMYCSKHCRDQANAKYHGRLCCKAWYSLRRRCTPEPHSETRTDPGTHEGELASLIEQFGGRHPAATSNRQMFLVPLVAAKLLAGAVQKLEEGATLLDSGETADGEEPVSRMATRCDDLLRTFPIGNMAGCDISNDDFDRLQLGWNTGELYFLTCRALRIQSSSSTDVIEGASQNHQLRLDLLTYKRFLAIAALNCISVKARTPFEGYVANLRSLRSEEKEGAMEWIFQHARDALAERCAGGNNTRLSQSEWRRLALSYYERKSRSESLAGFFLLHCKLNHRCEPCNNLRVVSRSFVDASIDVVAVRDIVQGEELTFSYLSAQDSSGSKAHRNAVLQLNYRFSCTCPRCEADADDDGQPAQ